LTEFWQYYDGLRDKCDWWNCRNDYEDGG